MPSFKVPKAGTEEAPGAGRWNDGELAEDYPALVDWLGDTKDEEGQMRATGTLLLFCSGTWLKARLNDRQTGYVAFVTAASWYELMSAAELGLRNGTLDWREDKAEHDKRKK